MGSYFHGAFLLCHLACSLVISNLQTLAFSSSLPRLLAVMIHLYDPAFRCSVFLILNPVAFVFGDLKNKK